MFEYFHGATVNRTIYLSIYRKFSQRLPRIGPKNCQELRTRGHFLEYPNELTRRQRRFTENSLYRGIFSMQLNVQFEKVRRSFSTVTGARRAGIMDGNNDAAARDCN